MFSHRVVSSLFVVALLKITAAFQATNHYGFAFRQKQRRPTALDASVVNGDTVLVVGGTGGVGQLVTKKLRNRGVKVRVTARDEERAKETIGDDGVEVSQLNLIDETSIDSLVSAMEGASAVVISVGTTAFPTLKWRDGNTPEEIDNKAVSRLAMAAAQVPTIKKVTLLTSVGVYRTNEMPFVILNLFGVLDAKRAGEDAVKAASKESSFEYVIVRPGRLVGGPYTNLDLAKLLSIEGGAENGVTVQEGDELLGDCKRDACAEAVIKALTDDRCGNVAFSIISNEEKALTDSQWGSVFDGMTGNLS